MRLPEKPKHSCSLGARIILWAQKLKYGESLGPSKVWARSPKLLYGLQALYRAIDRKSSPLEPSIRSLVGIKVSQINRCRFCVDIGEALLRKRGVDSEKVAAVLDHRASNVFSQREFVALDYAEAMTVSDQSVSDALFERLRGQFSDDEIIELTAVIAFQNLSSKFNAALDIPAQGFCALPSPKEKKV